MSSSLMIGEIELIKSPSFSYSLMSLRRRGAHWTFDVNSYINFVRLLSQDLDPNSPVLTAPSFNHALKDPTPEAIRIHPEHRIVLIEGLYTILSIEPWREAAELLHERWLLKVDTDKAKERLIKRHVISGVANDWDEATWRAENNDMPSTSFSNSAPFRTER